MGAADLLAYILAYPSFLLCSFAAGAGACTLQDFYKLAQPAQLSGDAAWCDACGNTQVTACVARNLQREQEGKILLPVAQLAVAFVVAIVGAITLTLAVVFCVQCCARRRAAKKKDMNFAFLPKEGVQVA